jgi:hypothetical protein
MIMQECFSVCPTNYIGSTSNLDIDVCSPATCGTRSPNTPTLCTVYEDANTAVECVKINDTTCSSGCPLNMAPVQQGSSGGLICDWVGCSERVPINGICGVANEATPCYSLTELGRCFETCPSHTTANTQTPGDPKCVATPCNSRSPDNRGLCLISVDDVCFTYNGQCLDSCPAGIGYGSDVDKV